MKLGRDFTNCLLPDYLSQEDSEALISGDLALSSANALVLEKYKRDVVGQIETISELGMSHLELDADPPNPYLDFNEKEKEEIRETAEENDVTISLHLPYTYIGSSLCCFQESDRKIATDLAKECLKFASDIGATQANTHPGTLPSYQAEGKYLEMAKDSLIKSLMELCETASEGGIKLHLENNVAFDNFLVEVDDCLEVVQRVEENGADLYFNLDIGHWFTRADAGESIPDNPVSIMEEVPADFVNELHLNDYVPEEVIFHPPLHLKWGLLEEKYLKEYAEIVDRKDVEVIVLETALKNIEQFEDRDQLLEDEARYVSEIFGV